MTTITEAFSIKKLVKYKSVTISEAINANKHDNCQHITQKVNLNTVRTKTMWLQILFPQLEAEKSK